MADFADTSQRFMALLAAFILAFKGASATVTQML
jgi:hypothetical protein